MSSTPALPPSAGFVCFASPVEGQIVSRYGSGTPTQAPAMIGVTRALIAREGKSPAVELSWDTDLVVGFTEAEMRIFRQEYADAFGSGALRKRTAADFDSWHLADQTQAADALAGRAALLEQREAKATADGSAQSVEPAEPADAAVSRGRSKARRGLEASDPND